MAEVSAAVARLVPEDVEVRAGGETVIVKTGDDVGYFPLGHNVRTMLLDGVPQDEAVVEAVRNLLNELQDVISVFLKTPWPLDATGKLAFAPLEVLAVPDGMEVWVGVPHHPTSQVSTIRRQPWGQCD